MNRRQKYLEYLGSNHWQTLRLSKLRSHGRFCAVCSSTSILHVHHIRYKEFLDCTEDDLAVLCETCHDDFHLASSVLKFDYREVEVAQIIQLLGQARSDEKFLRRKNCKKLRKQRRKERRLKAQETQTVPAVPKPPKIKKNKFKKRRRLIRLEYHKIIHADYNNASLKDFAAFLLELSNGPDIPEHVPEPVKYKPHEITPELIESLKTSIKGWTRPVLESVGVSWPPKSGWRKELLARYHPEL